MHLSPEALAGYLDGDLPGDERAPVELHLATCAACRDELAEVRRLQRRRRRRWVPVLVPAAAAAAAVVAVVLHRQPTPPSLTRAGPNPETPLGTVSPGPSAEIAPGPVTFTWRSAGPGASYTFTLQDADGRIAWTATLADTVAVLPDSLAARRGITRFWFVDALLPDGRSRSTGVNRLRIAP